MRAIEDDMILFLTKNEPEKVILSILSLTTKDWDDEIGFIGEHYNVRCELKVATGGTIKRTCYVNKKVFNDFRAKTHPITWE